MQNPTAPPGAYAPGTKLIVGSHQVVIKSYISEGGFAHVYTCHCSPADEDGSDIACLKRVVVPDKAHLNLLRAEVDAMKRLKGHPNIVRYIDSHAARMPGGVGYEVFLLMEYCSRHGLIDFMNTRLRDQLREHEILQIMYDITAGLAYMHYLQPPLIHRDLKIENVLISGDGTYKLCDFGSASPVLRQPRNTTEFYILEEDIQRHTTAQYRSPEMIDIYRGFPIDEKSDIWALGVFLYKLCYYTTPFEREGQLAILHARYVFPERPAYSDRLKRVISALLREDPRNRPNVYQVLKEICSMRGVEVPIKDIYSAAAKKVQQEKERMSLQQQEKQNQYREYSPERPDSYQPVTSAPTPAAPVGAGVTVRAPVPQHQPVDIPSVKPMPRGRPQVKSPVPLPSTETINNRLQAYTEAVSQEPSKQQPVPKKTAVFSDPFTLLDPGSAAGAPPASASGATTPGGQEVSMSVGAATPEPASALVNYDFDEAFQKYPTIEELTKNLEQQTFSFESPPKSRSHSRPPIERHAADFRSGSQSPVKSSPAESQTHKFPVQNSVSSGPDEDLILIDDNDNYDQRSSVKQRSQDEQLLDVSSDSSYEIPSSGQRPMPRVSVSPPLDSSDSQLMGPPPLPRRKPVSGPSSRPVSMYIQSSSSLVEDEPPRSPNLMDSVPNDDREELKKILTGLSQRSNTVILDDESNHIDSNVDFLRTLDNDKDVHRKSSTHSNHSRKPSYNSGTDSWKIRRTGSSASKHVKRASMSSLKGIINDAFGFSGGSRSASSESYEAVVRGKTPIDRAPSAEIRRPSTEARRTSTEARRATSKERKPSFEVGRKSVDDNRDGSGLKNYANNRYSFSTESLGNYSGSGVASQKNKWQEERKRVPIVRPKTTSAIQSRVQNFLRETESPPPRRTAHGYGKYTDDEQNDEITPVKSAPPPKPRRPSTDVAMRPTIKKVEPSVRQLEKPLPTAPKEHPTSAHARQLSRISSGSSNGSQGPPKVPSKPHYLRSPRRHRHQSSGEEYEDHVDQFNRKYPSLG
uniref:non-specific serine/threonine protein kinase n=1 Tax=Blastobotrys adeninivorans TaxID=409370 RepID=A0A060TCY2_BLAAD